MLALSISCERMEPVARRHSQIIEARSEINILKLSSSSLRNVSRNAFPFARGVELLRTPVRERLDHRRIVTRHVTRGNRVIVPHNAAVQRRRAALSSAQQAHNEMARLLRARDAASPSAATAC
jgi:hypothetical protein